jgi:membrane fusion protein (multidrug efflux system)
MRFVFPIFQTLFAATFFNSLPLATAQQPPRPPASVIAAEVRSTPFADRIEALGTLRANETVELTATVSDRVVETGFEDGDRVQTGQLLVKLSSTEEEALLKETTSAANESKKQYDRMAQLAERGTASVAQLDEARRVYETARARQLAIESRLAELVIKAPFDGVVGLRNISIGAVVRPGDLITTVDDDSKMLLDFSMPASFLEIVVPGIAIEASTASFGGRIFKGAVRSVSSRIDPVTRSVIVRAEIPNPDRILKPGMLMKVDLLGNPRNALTIPEGALLPAGRDNFVMLLDTTTDPPRATRREVQIGTRRKGEVEILSGLNEGEKVVAHGGFKLTEGTAVRILSETDRAKKSEDPLQERK